MNAYRDIMHWKLGDVITEHQFVWLREIVFLSALEEVTGSGEPTSGNAGRRPLPEAFELLHHVFGMSPQQFAERLASFERHRASKNEGKQDGR